MQNLQPLQPCVAVTHSGHTVTLNSVSSIAQWNEKHPDRPVEFSHHLETIPMLMFEDHPITRVLFDGFKFLPHDPLMVIAHVPHS